jgi:hypothetical protein
MIARLDYQYGDLDGAFGDNGAALVDFAEGTEASYAMAWDLGIADFGDGDRIADVEEACDDYVSSMLPHEKLPPGYKSYVVRYYKSTRYGIEHI